VTEFDPEDPEPEPSEFDPDSLGPEAPSVPDLGKQASEVDPATARLFWSLVFVFNVALFAMCLGAMFAFFEAEWRFGSQLFLGGAIVFAYGYYRYRRFEAE